MAGHENDKSEDAALRARLDALSSALEAERRSSQERTAEHDAANLSGQSFAGAMSLGFRVLSELIATVLVGGVIGWTLDKWSGAKPVFLIVFLLLGTAAGFWNVYRIAAKPTGSQGGGKQG
jgi:ATP synthase protein I